MDGQQFANVLDGLDWGLLLHNLLEQADEIYVGALDLGNAQTKIRHIGSDLWRPTVIRRVASLDGIFWQSSQRMKRPSRSLRHRPICIRGVAIDLDLPDRETLFESLILRVDE